MEPRLALVELVVADMATTLAFYRRLGVDVPLDADTEAHVDVKLGDIHVAFDTEVLIQSFDSSWSPPSGGAHRVALAFECETPEEVDRLWHELTDAGYHGHLAPWDAFWGMRYAIVHDPNGVPVDLFSALAPA